MKIFTKGGDILDKQIHDTMFPKDETHLQIEKTIEYMNESGLPNEEIIRKAMSICMFMINNMSYMPENELKEKMQSMGIKI